MFLLLPLLLLLCVCYGDALTPRAALPVARRCSQGKASATSKTSSTSTGFALRASAGGEQLGVVTMYKKEGCPYCKKAVELLVGTYQLELKFVDIESADREEILNQMRTFSGGRNTVPQIFFNSEHLGGNDDVQTLEAEGKLREKVETVRKTPVTMMMDHWYHPHY